MEAISVIAPNSATRYQRLNRRQALLVLAILLAAVAGCLFESLGPPPTISSGTGQADVALFYAVAERLHAGQPYYDAMGAELRARNYPTSSTFNWRTPLHLELAGHLPDLDWARGLLLLSAACAIGLTATATWREKRYVPALVQVPLLCIPLAITAMPNTFLFAEVWAGVWIAVSVGCYALEWRQAGALTGLLALFLRELALPYAAICAFLAYREKRRTELLVWLAGLGSYALYLGLHARAVLAHLPAVGAAPELAHWIQFGGPHFLLIASRTGLLLGFPFWVAALYLPLAVLGLAGWTSPVAVRVATTVAAYLMAFSVVGVPSMNFYWGAVYSPLLALGLTWALPACRDLLRAALALPVRRPSPARSPPQCAR